MSRSCIAFFGRLGETRFAAGAIGAALALTSGLASGQVTPFKVAPPLFWDSVEIDMVQAPSAQTILPGAPTLGSSYTRTVAFGPASTLVPVPGSYLGPTIHAWQGQNMTIRMHNQLTEESVTHWHGLDVPEDADGHPRFAFPAGSTYTYSFPIINRAGT